MTAELTREIVAADDSFAHHARPDDPFWNESGLFGFMVPERRIDGYFYVWHRPNMNLTSAGVALWDDQGSETHNCLYAEWFHFNPMAADTDMFDFELANGMRCKVREPLRSYELSFTSEEYSLDLVWTGAYHPPNLHYTGEHGFDIYGGVHYEQLGSVTGTIRLHGETIPVDCHHFRDHSRGPRPGPARNLPGGGFDFGWASERTSFAVTSARPDPRAPVTARSVDRVSYGHFTKDGVLGQVVDGTREVLDREPDGRPRRVVLDLRDEHGREMHAESQVQNCLKWHSIWHMQWCLASWTIDGEHGWGENQDWFDIEVIRAHQRRAMGASPSGVRPMIVSDPAELTTDWFSAALSGTVLDVRIEPMNIGAMCRMVRAELTWDPPRAGPASVVVKFPTAEVGTLALARAMRMYELEVRFYRGLLPLLDGVRTPTCHLAELDEDSGGFTLVLEDLSARTRPGDVLTESSADECAAVLGELATLQALSWDSPRTRAMPWLADPQRTVQIFDSMSAGLDPFLARFGHALAAEQVALFARVIPRAGEWIRSWGGPTVVQHGDLRTDNILFGTDGEQLTATLLDFQTVRLGPPGIDPAYFLGSSLSTPTRRALETDLLREFHGRLCTAGVTGFDFDACLRGYREGALYAVYLFCGLSVQVAPSERVDRVIADQTRRYADMALDLESAELAGLR